MTNTATRPEATPQVPPPARSAPPPKVRRRPIALLVAAALAVAGAVGAGLAWSATSDAREVLVAARTIPRGTVIDADDLRRVRVGSGTGLSAVGADAAGSVVGMRAALDIAAGSSISPDAVTDVVVPAAGESIVAVPLTTELGTRLAPGDKVRVVVTPSTPQTEPGGLPAFADGEVVTVHVDQATKQTVVDVLLPHGEALELTGGLAAGTAQLILDSREAG
ncbi:SAF domain-containing protein [Antribacter gilvus]|uniref:SAF domain-containing protein n=1 Tax=Antribacter gilvus TaxID=2304675 RepID=UPI000F7BA453|nr:SAF domain-containing protein [Antribacter gilvus]